MEQKVLIKHYSENGSLMTVYKNVSKESLKFLGERRILFSDADGLQMQLVGGIFAIRDERN